MFHNSSTFLSQSKQKMLNKRFPVLLCEPPDCCTHLLQVVSAVATLTKATTQLSQDTKDKMLDVANSGITAAKLSTKPLSPAEASRLWAVVAAGNDLKASCKVPGSCTQAANVGRRLLQELPEWLNVNTIYSRSLLESAAVTGPVIPSRHLLANVTSPSPAPATAPSTTTTPATATTTPAFVPSFAAQAGQVGDLLSQGAGPAAYLSGGDNGLYLSTANFLGRNYDIWSVVAGPALDDTGSQADSASGENAQLKFSKDLVALCVDVDGAVLSSGTCGDVVVPVRLTYLPDAGSLFAPAAASTRKLQQVDGHTIVSGAAVVDVAGDTNSAFPCDSCTATVSIPIWEQKQDWMLYDCGRIVDGVVTYSAANATSSGVQSVGTPAVPTVTCTVNKAGSYIIGKRADPSRPAGTPETDPAVEALVSYLAGIAPDLYTLPAEAKQHALAWVCQLCSIYAVHGDVIWSVQQCGILTAVPCNGQFVAAVCNAGCYILQVSDLLCYCHCCCRLLASH